MNWGDGTSDNITSANDPALTHDYGVTGSYDVTIQGDCVGFSCLSGSDRDKIIDILQWGTSVRFNDVIGSFLGISATNISASDIPVINGDVSDFFRGCGFLVSVNNIENWDMSNVTNMSGMFRQTFLFDENIGDWDVSNITSFFNMFANASNFNNGGSSTINNWNVSNMVLSRNMFDGATSFNQNIGSWDVTSLSIANNMLDDSNLSVANYDSLLIGWESQNVLNNVDFGADNIDYSAGGAAETARNALINDHIWEIIDGNAV